MFKPLIIIAMTITILSGCGKSEQTPSNEVLISITNKCRARIKVYDMNDTQTIHDIFDCSYVSILPIKVKPGKYKIKAETYQGKSVTKTFTKGVYAQTLDIEF
jgi:hypothetical protein